MKQENRNIKTYKTLYDFRWNGFYGEILPAGSIVKGYLVHRSIILTEVPKGTNVIDDLTHENLLVAGDLSWNKFSFEEIKN